MKTLNDIMELLTGPIVLNAIAELLRKNDPEFSETEKNYKIAVDCMRNNLGDSISPSVEEYLNACQTEVIADILYAAYLGYRANLENFHAPCQTFFYKADFPEYIRDHLRGHSPACWEASRTQNAFYKALPTEYHDAEDAVRDYYTHLNISGPKLAHYAGYMIANKFLPWVEPGYHEDHSQTLHYQSELRKYMGYLPLE